MLLAQEQIGHQEIEAVKEKAARSGPGEQQQRLEGLSRDETATSLATAELAPEPARNEIIQEVPVRWELLWRDAREGQQPGQRQFRLKLTPCSESLCGVHSPGQQHVGCPYPKKLRGAVRQVSPQERDGTKDTGCCCMVLGFPGAAGSQGPPLC